MHIKWQIHLRMGINAFHLVLFFVLKCVNVGFYIWHPINFQQITEIFFKLYGNENAVVVEGHCEVSLRSSSQQLYISNAIDFSRESNFKRICTLSGTARHFSDDFCPLFKLCFTAGIFEL